MSKTKKAKKAKKAKFSFADKLAIELTNSELGEVIQDSLNDGSGSWVELRVGDTTLTFSFNHDGSKLDGIALDKDVSAVVDTTRIWGHSNYKQLYKATAFKGK